MYSRAGYIILQMFQIVLFIEVMWFPIFYWIFSTYIKKLDSFLVTVDVKTVIDASFATCQINVSPPTHRTCSLVFIY